MARFRLLSAIVVFGSLFGHSALANESCNLLFSASVTTSGEVSSKVQEWRNRLRSTRSEQEQIKVKHEISEYAGKLVRESRNDEFVFLAKLMEFPINKTRGFDPMEGDIYYGRSLLEDAIYAKNYEVFRFLPTLSRDMGWSENQEPKIYVWTRKLTKVVVHDPVFKNEVGHLKSQKGEFDQSLAYRGEINESMLRKLQVVAETKNFRDLKHILSTVYKWGASGRILEGEYIENKGGLVFEAQIDRSMMGSSPGLTMTLYDRGYKDGERLASKRPKAVKFNLLDDHMAQGAVVVKELKVGPKAVRILIHRDQEARFYDGTGAYQEVTFYLNRKDDGRIERVQIRNGNNMLFRPLWKSLVLRIDQVED